MKTLSLEEVRRAVGGQWLGAPAGLSVSAVTTDTRAAQRGELFIALRGASMDGHAFLAQAARAGCAAAIVCRDARLGDGARGLFAGGLPPVDDTTAALGAAGLFPGGLIAVDDTTAALGLLAAFHRSQVRASVIGVTGSNGKTTVKRMIHHILAGKLAGSCSPKSFNNEIGVPLTLLGVQPDDDYVVCEIGTNAPGEIAHLAAMVRPDVAVITSVGETHLEKLGSVERVAVEKASLLACLEPSGLGVVWADSPELDLALKAYPRTPLVRFGRAASADLRLTACQPLRSAQRFQVNGRLWVDLPLAGEHMACDALAALAVAQRYGVELEEAAAALADFAGTEMRLCWTRCGEITLVNDAYNSNPPSLLAAVEVLMQAGEGRKVLVVGDMRELGDQAQAIHLRVGQQIASRKVDLLIGVGPLGRYIAMGAAGPDGRTHCFETLDEACRQVPALLAPQDVVLVKASRAMALEKLVDAIRRALQ